MKTLMLFVVFWCMSIARADAQSNSKEIWSALLTEKVYANTVMNEIANHDWEG